MTALDDNQPTRQAIAAQGRSGKLTVSGKLKVALDAMLFEGACRADAAALAGLTDHSVRAALNKPHVTAYYNAGLKVLRDSQRARNIMRLAEIRDAGNNMPAVQAIGMLERMNEEATANRASQVLQSPGLTIVISQVAPPALPDPKVIEHE